MVLMKSGRRPRLVVAALTAAAIAAGVNAAAGSVGAAPAASPSAATGSAGAAPSPPSVAAPVAPSGAASGHLMPLKFGLKPPARTLVGRPVAFDNCPEVRAQRAQDVARGLKAVSCVTTTNPIVPAPTRLKPQVAAPAAALSTCNAPAGQWVFMSRTDECIRDLTFTISVLNPSTTPESVIGTSTFSVNQDILLSTNSDLFVDNDTITLAEATGEFSAAGTVALLPACTAPCLLTLTPFSQAIALGETDAFSNTYEMPLASGANFSTQIGFVVDFVASEFPVVDRPTWTNLTNIRCDNNVAPGAVGTGCVFPGSWPTVELSAAAYGTAAVNVAIGENYLAGRPGFLTPLHRGDPNQRQGNMDAICDSSFMRNNLLVPTDSCDEYPFASSLESGGQLGLTGPNCLETIPQIVNGVWKVWFINDRTGLQLCERGHVPLAQNTGLGGSGLSPFYAGNRMLVGDAYFVETTN